MAAGNSLPIHRPLDRESLRAELRGWSELERRIALERVVEMLPDAEVEALLEGLVHLDEHAVPAGSRLPSLRERIDRHAAAARRGEFLGRYRLRNAHGEREPWQTTAWLAATVHLFELALERARHDAGEDALASLRELTALVNEVDERIDELVVFEDGSARLALGRELGLALELLDTKSSAGRDR